MKPWFEILPDRLEHELSELREEGWSYEIKEDSKAKGQLMLTVDVAVDGQHVHLFVVYPDTYPRTRMEVFAPELTLKRHQNPFGKNLCLLGASTINWRTTDTLASLLKTQLPLVLKIGLADDPSQYKEEEEPQGEPISVFYPSHAGSALFIDSAWNIPPEINEGQLEVRLDQSPTAIRGAVTRVMADGKELASAPSEITSLFVQRHIGYWVRWNDALPEPRPELFLKALFARKPGWAVKRPPAVFGLLLREEIGQNEFGDGWIFVVKTSAGNYLVRGTRAGRDDLRCRVPELRPLADKCVSLVGLGSLGAPSAIELARDSLGKLKIADFDDVEAGSVCRWPLGLSAAGDFKVAAIGEFIKRNYPFTNVEQILAAIGRVVQPSTYRDLKDLDSLVSSDLVYDATAEIGVQHVLSDAAREAHIPYVFVEGSPGMWGGIVARIVPGKTGCWMCLQRKIASKEIEPPPMSPSSGLQPPGCGHPTFTGSGFDAVTIAMAGVRLAVQTLCASTGRYPESPADAIVIALRDEVGTAIPPSYTAYVHRPTPGCESCGSAN
jgi:molybdopterin/thiamine biosynthesis adenylyltransferase